MSQSNRLRRAALAASLACLAWSTPSLLAQEVIDPAARQAQSASTGGQATAVRTTGLRQTKRDTAPGAQPLDRLVTRVENRVRNRVENRLDRDYNPQADPAASYSEATRRTRAVAPARRRR